jgi:Protein phosphatase 2C
VWKVIGASVPGASHAAAGTGCADACGWRADDELTCLVVADGAGSRPHSARGAALAVEHALQLTGLAAADRDPAELAERMRLIFAGVRERLGDLARTEGHAIGDYACTLAVAVLSRELMCIGQVGDTIAVTGSQGGYQTIIPAPQAEYVNETAFVTDPGWAGQLRTEVRPAWQVDAVFLSTDGMRFQILADLAEATPFTPFFEDAEVYARSPGADTDAVGRFLLALDDQSGDDKTLLVAVRDPVTEASARPGTPPRGLHGAAHDA